MVDRSSREAGDLGPQLVADTTLCGGDVGDSLGLEVGDLLSQASTTVAEHELGLNLGVGEDASTLALDVALGLADLSGLVGGGCLVAAAASVSFGCARCERPCSS